MRPFLFNTTNKQIEIITMNIESIFNNNRKDITYISGNTSRVSVLVENLSYQFERQLGSNVIHCVGTDCNFEISADQTTRLDQEFIVNSECRTIRTELLTEFKSNCIKCLRRDRRYDDAKPGDRTLTSKEVVLKFIEYGCNHILGNFYFVAHLADCCGIAHTGYNAYSEMDTIAACNKINRFPLTFESVRKTLNVSDVWLDYALRKVESKHGYEELRTTLVRGKVYNTAPLELFSPKIVDIIRSTPIDAPDSSLKYVDAEKMCDYVGIELWNKCSLNRLGIHPSKRKRGYYILADGDDRNKIITDFCYTVDDILDAVHVSAAKFYSILRSGVVSPQNTILANGTTRRRRFNAAGRAEIIAAVTASRIRESLDRFESAGVFY